MSSNGVRRWRAADSEAEAGGWRLHPICAEMLSMAQRHWHVQRTLHALRGCPRPCAQRLSSAERRVIQDPISTGIYGSSVCASRSRSGGVLEQPAGRMIICATRALRLVPSSPSTVVRAAKVRPLSSPLISKRRLPPSTRRSATCSETSDFSPPTRGSGFSAPSPIRPGKTAMRRQISPILRELMTKTQQHQLAARTSEPTSKQQFDVQTISAAISDKMLPEHVGSAGMSSRLRGNDGASKRLAAALAQRQRDSIKLELTWIGTRKMSLSLVEASLVLRTLRERDDRSLIGTAARLQDRGTPNGSRAQFFPTLKEHRPSDVMQIPTLQRRLLANSSTRSWLC
mmetsp:Transcript_3349/g.10604  ORF Transcript_3349/g.10604 Transcript_3349/m.10604 type:complete len:342 (-) Transcript_3349:607-1632(-)